MTWTIFSNLNSISTLQFDGNYDILAAQCALPCGISGTNTLVLTPEGNTPPISEYDAYQPFFAIAANTNTGAVTAAVGVLAALPVYKDTASGPVALVGGEIVATNAMTLTYDPALDTGSGGFHLTTGTGAFSGFLPLTGGVMSGGISGATSIAATKIAVGTGPFVTRVLSTTASVAFTSIAPGASQIQPVSLTGVAVGDNILVGLPSPPTGGVVFDGYVSVANVALLRATNATSASIVPFGATFRATGIGFT